MRQCLHLSFGRNKPNLLSMQFAVFDLHSNSINLSPMLQWILLYHFYICLLTILLIEDITIQYK